MTSAKTDRLPVQPFQMVSQREIYSFNAIRSISFGVMNRVRNQILIILQLVCEYRCCSGIQ